MWCSRNKFFICSKREWIRTSVVAVALVFSSSCVEPPDDNGAERANGVPSPAPRASSEDAPIAIWNIEYDGHDRPLKLLRANGEQSTFSYTQGSSGLVEQVQQRIDGGGTIEWQFDALGRLSSVDDQNGRTTQTFDTFGRLASSYREGFPEVAYQWDPLDRITAIHVGGHLNTATRYDYLGRVRTLQTPAGDVHYQYASGQHTIQRKLPNGVVTRWVYQHGGELARIVHIGPDRRVLLSFDYRYHADGRLAAVDEWASSRQRTVQFTYDSAKRLARVTHDANHKG